MEELIINIAEKHFFFAELEHDGHRSHIDDDGADEEDVNASSAITNLSQGSRANQPTSASRSTSDTGIKNATTRERYEKIQIAYEKTTTGLYHIFASVEQRKKWLDLRCRRS